MLPFVLVSVAYFGSISLLQKPQALLSTESIDACLISETHLIRDLYISINNYDTHHTRHPVNTIGDGSDVIIKNNIKRHDGENDMQAITTR